MEGHDVLETDGEPPDVDEAGHTQQHVVAEARIMVLAGLPCRLSEVGYRNIDSILYWDLDYTFDGLGQRKSLLQISQALIASVEMLEQKDLHLRGSRVRPGLEGKIGNQNLKNKIVYDIVFA